jgi:hypothetical protein
LSLTQNTLSNSITSIGYKCFSECSSFTQITLPTSITSIVDYCFKGCSSLTQITLPNSIKSIDDGCFSGCSSLTQISLPNSIKSIGKQCFSRCLSLKEINIPHSMTFIPLDCFSGCSSLKDQIQLYDQLAFSESLFEVDFGNEKGIVQQLKSTDSESIQSSGENVLKLDDSECVLDHEIQFTFQNPILLQGYLLRSRSKKYPVNWNIQGSKDENDWFLINQHENDEIIQKTFSSYKFQCFSFQTCSFIKITSNDSKSSLSFVDFFGKTFISFIRITKIHLQIFE